MKQYFEDLGHYLSLKDRVYQNVKFQIMNANLKPGIRLFEEELAKAMNISRAPIREAFDQLEKEGFVTIIPRKGAWETNNRINQRRKGGAKKFDFSYDSVEIENENKEVLEHQFVTTS